MCHVLFCFLPWEAVRGRATMKNSLSLPWTGMSRLSLHPVICVPFEFLIMDSSLCLLLSLTKHSLMTRLWQMTLGKITWASIIVFSVFYQIDPPPSPPYLCCSFLSLSGLFSTQQLHADVETLSFMVFGGKRSGLRREREYFIRRL